jgi:hypothetical protein
VYPLVGHVLIGHGSRRVWVALMTCLEPVPQCEDPQSWLHLRASVLMPPLDPQIPQ